MGCPGRARGCGFVGGCPFFENSTACLNEPVPGSRAVDPCVLGVCGLGSFGFFASALLLGWGFLLGFFSVGLCGWLSALGAVCWCLGWGVACCCALLESLILAQDERWRRA